ncbi:heme exporter protein A [Actimicrobium sp. GrIS 1.19]|uniref:cytochrome c biogenesis heme-transporting ATPase CcmA n=1 Tax=Actimicrobium sp. GrIS 1.19 TaxID=3071708 RepID=UPI002DFA5FA2|nr:heme exporter protein A [Actimicrobium sp. GrIS 1.19]
MMLQASELACTRGERALFTDINIHLDAGDAMRVAGANGSGKTSLLRLLCGLAFPAAGEVRWKGNNIRSMREEFGAQMLYLGHAIGVKDDLLAWENLVVATTLAGHPVGRERAIEELEQAGLADAAELPAGALSQGQRKRVALARLGLSRTMPLWILDEPFTALDQGAVSQLCDTMNVHLAQGGIVIYTTHQEIDLRGQRLVHLDLSGDNSC